MVEKCKVISFGRTRIPNDNKLSANYESKKWSEISREHCISMYDIMPGIHNSVDMSTVNKKFGGHLNIEICPECGFPMGEHELREEYIEKIKRREENKPIRINDITSLLINQ